MNEAVTNKLDKARRMYRQAIGELGGDVAEVDFPPSVGVRVVLQEHTAVVDISEWLRSHCTIPSENIKVLANVMEQTEFAFRTNYLPARNGLTIRELLDALINAKLFLRTFAEFTGYENPKSIALVVSPRSSIDIRWERVIYNLHSSPPMSADAGTIMLAAPGLPSLGRFEPDKHPDCAIVEVHLAQDEANIIVRFNRGGIVQRLKEACAQDEFSSIKSAACVPKKPVPAPAWNGKVLDWDQCPSVNGSERAFLTALIARVSAVERLAPCCKQLLIIPLKGLSIGYVLEVRKALLDNTAFSHIKIGSAAATGEEHLKCSETFNIADFQ